MVKAATEARTMWICRSVFSTFAERFWNSFSNVSLYTVVHSYTFARFPPVWDNYSSYVFVGDKWGKGAPSSNMQDSFCKLSCNNSENQVEQSLFYTWGNKGTCRLRNCPKSQPVSHLPRISNQTKLVAKNYVLFIWLGLPFRRYIVNLNSWLFSSFPDSFLLV